MATFGELKTEATTLVIDVPTAVSQLMGSFVNRAVRKLQQKHNFKTMERVLNAVTVVDVRLLAELPTDWKQPRNKPYHTLGNDPDQSGYSRLYWGSEDAELFARYNMQAGMPRALIHDGQTNELRVYPLPDGQSTDYVDGEYRIVIPYWGYLPTMINDSDANWFTNNAEQWIVYQAVSEAFFANEDEQRAQLWQQRASREYADILLLDKDRSMVETDTFAYHTGAVPPHLQE